MYLHLGEDVSVSDKEIVGIFSINEKNIADNSSFLRFSSEDGFVIKIGEDKAKSFILCHRKGKPIIYLSPISSVTLYKRSRGQGGSYGRER